jgi:hypothetical protein
MGTPGQGFGGKLGKSYAVDLPNGATIITSSNDDNAEANMTLVAAAPHPSARVLPSAQSLRQRRREQRTCRDWDDIDIAHDAADVAVGIASVNRP